MFLYSHSPSIQSRKGMVLSAADEVTRQHCMRIIEAASSGISSPLHGIASAEALTRNLLDMKSLSAINAVFVVLGIAMSDPRLKAVGLDLPSLKAAGFDAAAFKAAGLDVSTMKIAGFTAAQVKTAGCDCLSAMGAGYDLPSLKAAGFSAAALKSAGCSFSALVLAGFSAAELTEAGFSSEVKVSYADIFCIFAMKS